MVDIHSEAMNTYYRVGQSELPPDNLRGALQHISQHITWSTTGGLRSGTATI